MELFVTLELTLAVLCSRHDSSVLCFLKSFCHTGPVPIKRKLFDNTERDYNEVKKLEIKSL